MVSRDPFYSHGLTLILAWISTHMLSKVWYKVTKPFPNFHGCIVENWEWMCKFIPYFIKDASTYPWWRLTHWGRATHICISKLTIIASDNGLSPGRRQAIIQNNAGILSIGLLGANFSEILIENLTFSFKKMCLKVSSAKWRPFCFCLNVLMVEQVEGGATVVRPRWINSNKPMDHLLTSIWWLI